jgi:predicted transcriptional regulator
VPTLYGRAIRRAAELYGEEALAHRLGVSRAQLQWWTKGLAEPPAHVFLKVADILGEHVLEELKHRDPGSG